MCFALDSSMGILASSLNEWCDSAGKLKMGWIGIQIWPWKSIAPQNNRELNQCDLQLYGKIDDSRLKR